MREEKVPQAHFRVPGPEWRFGAGHNPNNRTVSACLSGGTRAAITGELTLTTTTTTEIICVVSSRCPAKIGFRLQLAGVK